MVQKTLVLYSGGIDSIGMLWHLLNETDDEIYVQHYRINGFWPHMKAELAATKTSLAYIKERCRPFKVLPSFEYECEGIAPYFHLFAFLPAITSNKYSFDRIVRGRMANDEFPIFDEKQKTLLNIFNLIVDDSCFYEYPFINEQKKSWFKLLPKELVDLAITCRWPEYKNGIWVECGQCTSCKRAAEAVTGHDTTPANQWQRSDTFQKWDNDIMDIFYEKKTMFFVTESNCNNIQKQLDNIKQYILIQPIILDTNPSKNLLSTLNKLKSNKVYIRPYIKLTSDEEYSVDTKLLMETFCMANAMAYYHRLVKNYVIPNQNYNTNTQKQLILECIKNKEIAQDNIDSI